LFTRGIELYRFAGYILLKFLTVFGAEAHRRPKFEDESQAVSSHRLVGGPPVEKQNRPKPACFVLL
jgi:hypothetical protein